MKNICLKFILIFLTFSVATRLYAQKPGIYFDRLDVKNGLPEGQARAIVEDKEGFIWIGTQNGLVRYNGYGCKIYNLGSDKTNKDAVTNVFSVLIDKSNTLWVAAINNGLFRYNRETDSFDQFVFPKKHSIINLKLTVVDNSGNVWGKGTTWESIWVAVKFDPKTRLFTYFSRAEKGNNFINSRTINSVYKVASGDIFITTNNGFYKYNGAGKPLKGYLTTADTGKTRGVNPFYEAPSEPGVFWMNTFHGQNYNLRVTRFDIHTGTIKEYGASNLRDSIFDAGFNDVYEDKLKQLWFTTEQGLSKLDRKTGRFSNYLPGDTVGKNSSNNLLDLWETKDGNFWLTAGEGLIYFNAKTGRFERYTANKSVAGSLGSNHVIAKMLDHTGVLWVGSSKVGVGRINYAKSAFKVLKPVAGNPGKYPEEFAVTPATGEYSWATGKHGIYKWYSATNEFVKQYTPDTGEEYSCLVVAGANGIIYTAVKTTIIAYNTLTGKQERYKIAGPGIEDYPNDQITTLYVDHTNTLWIGIGNNGIVAFNTATKKFRGYPHKQGRFNDVRVDDGRLDDSKVLSILEDSHRTLWVGTNNGGINKLDREKQRFISYYNGKNRQLYCVDDIFEDKQGRFWLGTYLTGLFLFDREKGTYTKHFNEGSGLLFNSESGLNEDNKGRIWMLSERGLSRIDAASGIIRNFEFSKILPGIDILDNLSMLTMLPNGKFGFALKNGYVTFNPADLDDNPNPPVVHIESIVYNDPLANDQSGTRLIRYGIKSLELKHNQNRLQFNYVGLQYDDPAKNTYAYKLDGYDKQWIMAGTQRSVTYTNLPAGDYTFHVKAANSDGVWSTVFDSIRVNILSPWWLRWWAWLIYFALFAFAAYSYINYRQRHLQEENRLLEEKIEERTLELSQANKVLSEQGEEITAQRDQLADTVTELKTTQQQLVQSEKLASLGELTAGIAHEIQNPLNFVNNFSEVSIELTAEMKEELNAGNTEDAIALANDIEQNLQKILHHGKRADAIVKNMLQHSRNNSGDKQLTNINALADEYLRLAYHGLRAKDKSFNATLITNFDDSLPKVNIIPQDIGRVLLNIINNAFYALQQKQKNTGTDYKPTLELSAISKDDLVEIVIKDNGTGIPEHIKDKIMQPFFTTKPTGEGTGLGLSLSYDIVVKGHGGKINIETLDGEYTKFLIVLPVG